MTDDRELRRRAQSLLDRPPYEPLSSDDLRARAATRQHRARRRIVGGLCVVVVAAAAIVIARYQGRTDDRVVTVAPSTTAPPVTVPAGTTIADLRLTSIAGPDGTTRVDLYAAGDRFLAIEGDQGVERAWTGDASGRWRAIDVPDELRGTFIKVVQQLRDRVVVIGTSVHGRVVLEGRSLDHLKVSRWSSKSPTLPAVVYPPPPLGRGIVASGDVDATAVGDHGIVMVGRAAATLNHALLPKSVRDALRTRPGRVDVRGGRVIVTDSGASSTSTIFDRPARALGLSAAETDYLERLGNSSQVVVWGAAWGKPIRQLPGSGIEKFGRYGNFELTRVTDGFVLTAPDAATTSAVWSSTDGRRWRKLAAPPRSLAGLIEVGSRWVVASAGVVSDDEGRSWIPTDLSDDLAAHSGSTLFTPGGTSAFGLLGSSNALDVPSLTVFAGRLLYSPDGAHWSSVALAEVLRFDANIPYLAVGNTSAILESGLRALGVQAQRFWLVTRR